MTYIRTQNINSYIVYFTLPFACSTLKDWTAFIIQ